MSCVHPTVKGQPCKNPAEFLCAVHLINLRVEHRVGDVYFAPKLNMLVAQLPNGDYEPAVEMDHEEEEKPAGYISCGNCRTRLKSSTPWHATREDVKACYAAQYGVST